MTTLTEVLRAEKSVFQHFSTRQQLSERAEAFMTPQAKKEPHWNVVYPEPLDHRFTPAELDKADEFFGAEAVRGHVMTFDPKWADVAVERSHYFVASQQAWDPDELEVEDITGHDKAVLDKLTAITSAVFHWDRATQDYFRNMVDILAARVETRCWFAKEGDRTVAACNTFRGAGDTDFLFNVGVLPEFSGKHIATRMLRRVVATALRPVLVYSATPAMIQSILPKSGFRHVGEIFVVPTDSYRARAL